MFIVIVKRRIECPEGDDWYVLNCYVLPFPPIPGMTLKDSVLTIELFAVTWDREAGYFTAYTDHETPELGKSAEEHAKGLLSEKGWKVAIPEAELEEACGKLFTQARHELQTALMRASMNKPGVVPVPFPAPPGGRGR